MLLIRPCSNLIITVYRKLKLVKDLQYGKMLLCTHEAVK